MYLKGSFLITILGYFFLTIPAWAQQKDAPDTHSYKFLDIPSSPYSLATGGLSLTYIDANPASSFDNPALFGQETAGQIYLSYFNYMRGIHAMNAIYGAGVGERGTWATGIRATHYGQMAGYDPNNVSTGTFSAMDAALQGLFSYDLTDKIRGGLALKMIYGHIESYNAWAIATDAGISYYDGAAGTSIGLALTNIGGTLKSFGSRRTLPPWDIRIGYSQALSHAPFRLHFVLHGLSPHHLRHIGMGQKTLNRIISHFTLGAEFTPNEQFWVGIGYNPNAAFTLPSSGSKSFSGLSLGVGFNHDHFRLALATAVYHPQVLGFMFSISTNLGSDRYIF